MLYQKRVHKTYILLYQMEKYTKTSENQDNMISY